MEEKNKVFGGKYKILEKGKTKGTDMFINYRHIESDIYHDNNLPKSLLRRFKKMIVDYNEVVKELLEENILQYKKGIFKNKGDTLTEIEKLLYSDNRLPLKSYLVIGDIVVELYTTKITTDNMSYYETTLSLTDKNPITMVSDVSDISDDTVLSKCFDIYQAINNHTIYTNLIIKLNKKVLKQHPEINNITNI